MKTKTVTPRKPAPKRKAWLVLVRPKDDSPRDKHGILTTWVVEEYDGRGKWRSAYYWYDRRHDKASAQKFANTLRERRRVTLPRGRR